jgi:hypothetical protein
MSSPTRDRRISSVMGEGREKRATRTRDPQPETGDGSWNQLNGCLEARQLSERPGRS